MTVPSTTTRRPAADVAAEVLDPELPALTLADLGILRAVHEDGDDIVVTITPTYSGCPAMATMRADLQLRLRAAGYAHVEVRTQLHPAWTTDWITAEGRRKLHVAGISPPGAAPRPADGPVPLTLGRRPSSVSCPRCGSPETRESSRFGSTACKSQHRCLRCDEPFEHVKEI
jgi:ring-1,2-phenylacetyl-CoA epoxidase subunit PaaD